MTGLPSISAGAETIVSKVVIGDAKFVATRTLPASGFLASSPLMIRRFPTPAGSCWFTLPVCRPPSFWRTR